MRWCQDELQLVSRGNDVEVLVWNAATLDSARGAAAPPRGALDRLAGRSSECSPLAADDRNYGGQRQCRRWQPRSSGSCSRVCSGSIGSSGPPTVASDPALTPSGVPQVSRFSDWQPPWPGHVVLGRLQRQAASLSRSPPSSFPPSLRPSGGNAAHQRNGVDSFSQQDWLRDALGLPTPCLFVAMGPAVGAAGGPLPHGDPSRWRGVAVRLPPRSPWRRTTAELPPPAQAPPAEATGTVGGMERVWGREGERSWEGRWVRRDTHNRSDKAV